jgi:rubrerythrin
MRMNQQPGMTKAGWERLIQAYDAMLQRVEQGLDTAAAGSETALAHALYAARRTAVDLGELTREEADKVHEFVSRDLYDAGQQLAMEEREVADRLRLGTLSVEQALLQRFARLAQAAKLELRHLDKARRRLAEWHTGEVTGIGVLRCRHCGELLHFERTGRIPPCPRCHATVFERARE